MTVFADCVRVRPISPWRGFTLFSLKFRNRHERSELAELNVETMHHCFHSQQRDQSSRHLKPSRDQYISAPGSVRIAARFSFSTLALFKANISPCFSQTKESHRVQRGLTKKPERVGFSLAPTASIDINRNSRIFSLALKHCMR